LICLNDVSGLKLQILRVFRETGLSRNLVTLQPQLTPHGQVLKLPT